VDKTGVFGIVKNHTEGEIVITPLNDPSLQESTEVINGAFSIPSLRTIRGQFSLVYTDFNNRQIKRTFTKDASSYYVCTAGDATAMPLLSLGEGCGTSNQTLCGSVYIPINLSNLNGVEIASTCNEIYYDSQLLEFVNCEIGPVGEAMEKNITSCEIVSDGLVEVCIGGNANHISNGDLAYAVFQLNSDSCGNVIDLINDPRAWNPEGNSVEVGGDGGRITSTRYGDLNCDFSVTIDETIDVFKMYLSENPVDFTGHSNCNEKVTVNDVVKSINCHLETNACPCGS